MNRATQKLSPLFAAMVLITAAIAYASSQTIVVVGQNDAAVDRAAIQAAVDSADEGDTVELQGLFQLDGEPILVEMSELTIAGQAVDNDGDGSDNEDPADGVDNDGDGLIDEDDWETVLQGVDDGAGGPARDAFPDRFNDGIEILGFDGDLEEIEIRDIKFSKLNRSIYLFPDFDDDGTVFVCDSLTPASGELEDVEIEGNSFENSVRGVEMVGRVEGVSIENNRFSGLVQQNVVMFGSELLCAEADGSLVQPRFLGIPEKTEVKGNVMDGGLIGVLSFVSEKAEVSCNQMSNQGFGGVISVEDEKLKVSSNDIDGAFIGVLGSVDPRVTGPATGNKLQSNSVSNTVFGIVVDCDTTGYKIEGNTFQGSGFVDVLLDGTNGGFCGGSTGDSFDNKATVDSATSVLDAGRDNTVEIDDDSDSDSDSDCDSD